MLMIKASRLLLFSSHGNWLNLLNSLRNSLLSSRLCFVFHSPHLPGHIKHHVPYPQESDLWLILMLRIPFILKTFKNQTATCRYLVYQRHIMQVELSCILDTLIHSAVHSKNVVALETTKVQNNSKINPTDRIIQRRFRCTQQFYKSKKIYCIRNRGGRSFPH